MSPLETQRESLLVKPAALKAAEFFSLSLLVLFFLSRIFSYVYAPLSKMPEWLDQWHMASALQLQVTRILGLNPGGLWDGGLYYPFHRDSLLFDEPFWGVSLMAAPFWAMTQNIFVILRIGGIPALALALICTYYFVKSLGGARFWSFCAGATFCLSGVSLILITGECCFWPFFLIPLLGIITEKIFSTSKLYWGILWGALFGLLAWSSAHLFVMGGVFLGLLVLWNLRFQNHSKKTRVALLIGLVLSALMAAGVLGTTYFTYEKYGFYRNFNAYHSYATNWPNLFFRRWPALPFNPVAITPLWDYLGGIAKGDTNIGISVVLFLGAIAIFIARLWAPNEDQAKGRLSVFRVILSSVMGGLFPYLNMWSLTIRCSQLKLPLPELAVGMTYLFYACGGIIFCVLSGRIFSAIKRLDFFLLLGAIFFGLLAFGPFYLTGSGQVVASPVAFLIYLVPGISGIQALARWGLLLSFSLSVAVAVFLSQPTIRRRTKILAFALSVIAFLEVSPGLGFGGSVSELLRRTPYQWTPRESDVFLKNLPGHGAVLRLSNYPLRRRHQVSSVNYLGYSLFSRLYHKKPLVIGYGAYIPHVTQRYLYGPVEKTLSPRVIHNLRKFGATYWVIHIGGWSLEEVRTLKDSTGELKEIAELDQGMTLIYEDPDPRASVGYFDIKK